MGPGQQPPNLKDLLKNGGLDRGALKKLQEQAAGAGLTKKIIHIELDLVTGQLKSSTTPMDNVMILGIIEFYKTTVIAGMLGARVAPPAPPEQGTEPCGHAFGDKKCNLLKGHDGHHEQLAAPQAPPKPAAEAPEEAEKFSTGDCCHRNSPGENHAPGCKSLPSSTEEAPAQG
jgi:hypothetical protein